MASMRKPASPPGLDQLPRTPATDVKKLGWRGVMRTVKLKGKVLVTHHGHPEAVILPVDEYQALMQVVHQAEAKTESALDALRRRFDERLAALQAENAGDRLRAVMRGPARLRGKVKAGDSH